MLNTYTVIRFVRVSAKFGTCTVVSVMGHLLKIKCVDSRVNVHIFASTTVSFKITTVQVPNLALTHTKRPDNSVYSSTIQSWGCLKLLNPCWVFSLQYIYLWSLEGDHMSNFLCCSGQQFLS